MRDHRGIERVFALFVSADCAEALAGDLVQERPERGSAWFWRQVAATIAILWGGAIARAPLRILVLAVAGSVFLAIPMFAGVAAVSLFPALLSGLVIFLMLSFFWWGGAFWAGASVVGLSPPRGMAACATLAAMVEVLLLALWASGVRFDAGSDTSSIFYVTGAVAAVPLLFGGAFAHARSMASPNRAREQR
jgi:hypothetical protein